MVRKETPNRSFLWSLKSSSISFDDALKQVRSTSYDNKVDFSVRFEPFQIAPDFPDSIDKHEWYLANLWRGDPAVQEQTQAQISSMAEKSGTTIRWEGLMGNTFHAHRVIQYFQDRDGPAAAERIIDALRRLYFEEGRHPSANETLLQACDEAGVQAQAARDVIEDPTLGAASLKTKLGEVRSRFDKSPTIVIVGKKGEITLAGLKTVAEYVEALERVIQESV